MKGVDSEDNTQLHHEHSFRRYLSYLSKVASISSPSRGAHSSKQLSWGGKNLLQAG